MNIKKLITSGIAAGSILVNMTLPVLAGTTTIQISGNGQSTDNDANVTVVNTTTVVQTNNADIENDVDVNSSTGYNDANDNVGGDVEIETGDVDAKVNIANTANSNVAEVDGCCEQEVDVLIEGNVRDSDNTVNLESTTETALFQVNEADVDNDVDVDSSTGGNDANDNAGGNVSIKTGSVDVDDIKIINTLNSNSAWLGGSEGGLSLSARIIGNGQGTDNDINLEVARLLLVTQENEADVDNDVDVESKTGYNDANDNVGGDVEIETGEVDVKVLLDTLANFNWASVECDCLGNVWTKIADNVEDSDNEINAKLVSDLAVFQDNCGEGAQAGEYGGGHHRGGDCGVDNDVDVESKTGGNDSNDNGGDTDSDPSILTGDVDVDVAASTAGNSNAYGDDSPAVDFDLPFGGFNLNISLDWEDLLNYLGL